MVINNIIAHNLSSFYLRCTLVLRYRQQCYSYYYWSENSNTNYFSKLSGTIASEVMLLVLGYKTLKRNPKTESMKYFIGQLHNAVVSFWQTHLRVCRCIYCKRFPVPHYVSLLFRSYTDQVVDSKPQCRQLPPPSLQNYTTKVKINPQAIYKVFTEKSKWWKVILLLATA